jgi:two-component system sensor histidine kinase KdpD
VTTAGAAWRETGISLAAIAAATIAALSLRPYLAASNLVMLYLLAVMIVALRCSRGAAILASVLSVAAFDYFCVPPYFTFTVEDTQYLFTFGVMLAVALVISTQTARIRQQASHAKEREAQARALYRVSGSLSGETRVFDLARAAASVTEEVLSSHVVIFLPEEGTLSFRRRTSDQLPVPSAEASIARRAFEEGHATGRGVDARSPALAMYVPLRGARETVGVMAVIPGSAKDASLAEQRPLIDALAGQIALAIERNLSRSAAEAARMEVQTEQMRSSLLSAVSHDLRTPRASITGAASTLRSQEDRLSAETRRELLDSISEEAERLSRLVSNLLDMTRLESGGVELRRDFYPLEEIVGSALARMESQLDGRPVVTRLPADLPVIHADDVLLGQAILNLLENAIKYTPPGSAIDIAAQQEGAQVLLTVRDHGPGFQAEEQERIFEKFYRGKSKAARGAGLGLAICRAIIDAHGGRIEAANHPEGGALFRIHLPLEKTP